MQLKVVVTKGTQKFVRYFDDQKYNIDLLLFAHLLDFV